MNVRASQEYHQDCPLGQIVKYQKKRISSSFRIITCKYRSHLPDISLLFYRPIITPHCHCHSIAQIHCPAPFLISLTYISFSRHTKSYPPHHHHHHHRIFFPVVVRYGTYITKHRHAKCAARSKQGSKQASKQSKEELNARKCSKKGQECKT